MLRTLFKKSLVWDPGSPVSGWGHLILRVSAGLMLFYIHGWHKLEGGIAYLEHGTPWKLAEVIAGMHFPAPVASAFAATAVESICAPLLAVGLLTRLNAVLLTATLGVAIFQNVLTGKDAELAVVYALVTGSLALSMTRSAKDPNRNNDQLKEQPTAGRRGVGQTAEADL